MNAFSDTLLALAVLAPLTGALVLATVGVRLERAFGPRAAGVLGSATVLVGAAAALLLLPAARDGASATGWTWFAVDDLSVRIGLSLDPLTAVLAVVVGFVGLLVHLYAVAFMEDERDRPRFFAAMNLFVASMLVLVLADDLLLLFLGWEGVGLCSFLLIGFWYERPEAVAAARKALVVTRVGDAAMMLGLFVLATRLGTLEIESVLARASASWTVGEGVAVAVAALLLAGAAGKSAQLPLHLWLPDAMAGPTPVSALIHAATMVTAGVFLLARLHPLFALAPVVQQVVAWLGVATLLVAALAAMVQNDLKRILAWSTISQLGYMFLALGVGAAGAAVFHLFTHAFFKALLFLAAGSVSLRLHHEHDVRRMGGLRTHMPFTFATFVVGAAALAGVPFLTAGFFSKEWVLASAFGGGAGGWLWTLGAVGVVLTAAYATRAVMVVFFGPVRTQPEGRTPLLIAFPLAVLALLSIVAGWLQTPAWLGGVHLFAEFVDGAVPASAVHLSTPTELALGAGAMLAVGIGFALALVRFAPRPDVADWGVGSTAERAARSGFGLDALSRGIVARPWVGLAGLVRADLLDAASDGVGHGVTWLHRSASATQNGRVRWTVGAIVIGCVLLLVVEVAG